MSEYAWLAERFEVERPHLRAVAYRLLGSRSEADDAVQDAWLRLSRSDTSGIENLGGWLTTVVARICLDMLRARSAQREESLPLQGAGEGAHEPKPITDRAEVTAAGAGDSGNPEDEVLMADAVGLALLVLLDTLTPAERLAFVLHDIFDVPFDEIAPIVDRSPTAARQLASRARRRVRGQGQQAAQEQEQASTTAHDADPTRQQAVVKAFLAASRAGDFNALLALLDPDIVCRADRAAIALGAPEEIRGATAVARQFSGRALGARPALVNGAAGAVWAPGGQPRVVFGFTVTDGRIVAIDALTDPALLTQLDLKPIEDGA